MADTDRELCLAAIKTDLEAINGAGNYSNKVRTVSRDLLGPDELSNLPGIAMWDEGDELDAQHSSFRNHMKIQLALVMYLSNDSAEAASTLCNSWLGDLHEAMMAGSNLHHNGKAHNTTFTGYEPLPMESATITGFVARYEVHYTFKANNPNNV